MKQYCWRERAFLGQLAHCLWQCYAARSSASPPLQAINCAFSGRINIGAKIVDAARGTASIRTDRFPRISSGISFFRRSTVREHKAEGGRLVTVVSVGRNCVLAAQMCYALSTFIRTCHPPPPVFVAVGRPSRRTGGVLGSCPDLHDMVIFLDTRQQCHSVHDSLSLSLSISSSLSLSFSLIYATYGPYAVLRHSGPWRHI